MWKRCRDGEFLLCKPLLLCYHPSLVRIPFGMPSLHLFTFIMFLFFFHFLYIKAGMVSFYALWTWGHSYQTAAGPWKLQSICFCLPYNEKHPVIEFLPQKQLCRRSSKSVSYSVRKFYQQIGVNLAAPQLVDKVDSWTCTVLTRTYAPPFCRLDLAKSMGGLIIE